MVSGHYSEQRLGQWPQTRFTASLWPTCMMALLVGPFPFTWALFGKQRISPLKESLLSILEPNSGPSSAILVITEQDLFIQAVPLTSVGLLP